MDGNERWGERERITLTLLQNCILVTLAVSRLQERGVRVRNCRRQRSMALPSSRGLVLLLQLFASSYSYKFY